LALWLIGCYSYGFCASIFPPGSRLMLQSYEKYESKSNLFAGMTSVILPTLSGSRRRSKIISPNPNHISARVQNKPWILRTNQISGPIKELKKMRLHRPVWLQYSFSLVFLTCLSLVHQASTSFNQKNPISTSQWPQLKL